MDNNEFLNYLTVVCNNRKISIEKENKIRKSKFTIDEVYRKLALLGLNIEQNLEICFALCYNFWELESCIVEKERLISLVVSAIDLIIKLSGDDKVELNKIVSKILKNKDVALLEKDLRKVDFMTKVVIHGKEYILDMDQSDSSSVMVGIKNNTSIIYLVIKKKMMLISDYQIVDDDLFGIGIIKNENDIETTFIKKQRDCDDKIYDFLILH